MWNISTTVSFSHRKAQTGYSLFDRSLIWVANFSDGTPAPIMPADLFRVFNVMFTISETNVTMPTGLCAFLTASLEGSPSEDPIYLRALLAYPVVTFQNNSAFNPEQFFHAAYTAPVLGLPTELYVTGQHTNIGMRVVIAPWTAIVYISLSLAVYLWCIAWSMWSIISLKGPKTSTFPLMNVMSNMAAAEMTRNIIGKLIVRCPRGEEMSKELERMRIFLVGDPGVEELRRLCTPSGSD